ncbi:hypothetical protein HN873_001947 [Arachis hypogaea]
MFLCLTVQHVISPWYIDTVLDVSDPWRYSWSLHIFKSLEQAIRKYKRKQNKSCKGCMFALLMLYFQKLKHDELENCQEHVSWLSTWTTEELSVMAETVQPKDCNEPGGNDGGVMEGVAREDTMDASPEREDVNHTIRLGSDRRDGVREGSMHTDTHEIASEGDADDDKSIAKRLC